MNENTKLIAVAAILVFIFSGGGAAIVSGLAWLGAMMIKVIVASVVAYGALSVSYLLFNAYMGRSSEASGVVFA